MASRREIIDRIEKLYALASGGTSPGEAAAATAMAEKLAKKHGIHASEINKETYTKGTNAKSTTKQHTRYDDAASYWRKASGPSWDNYTNWQKDRDQQRRKDYEDFSRSYYQHTFNPEFVVADVIRETAKAVLLNVHLDASKYSWIKATRITVSAWIPKSQVTTNIGNIWLLNKSLLLRNLQDNIPWLREHHPVFKGQLTITFHFKEPI